MAATTDFVFHSAVFLSLFKCCSAYCYGYCWYGTWYIWFAIIVVLAIGCGSLGAYLRHRNVQRALHQTQTAVTVQVADAGPPGNMMMTPPQGGVMMSPPPGGMMMPPPPGGVMMSPPDYNTVTAHGAYTNQNFQMTEGQQEKGGPLPMGQPQANHPYHTQTPYPTPLPPYSTQQPPYSTQAPYPTQQPAYPTQQPYPSQSPYPTQPPYSPTAPSVNKY